MRPRRLLAGARMVGFAIALSCLPGGSWARDYGQHGTLFPVIETDMLAAIEHKLLVLKASGEMAAMQRRIVRETEAKVRRPTPVAGLTMTTDRRVWTYDPSITVPQDIRDTAGRLIVAAGTHVNPLDHVAMHHRLVFIDGDDPAQVRWAMETTSDLNAKIVLTNGAPLAVMDAQKRRVYFDQRGILTGKFGIRHVPAVVEQAGRVLRVSELVVPHAGEARGGSAG